MAAGFYRDSEGPEREGAGEVGEVSLVSKCLPSREMGRRNRETEAAVGGPLGTKPFLKSQHAGWLNSLVTDTARKSQ